MQAKSSILIFTQSQDETKLLQYLLHHYDLTFKNNNKEALAYVKEHLPDLIIVDGNAADESAFTLCKMLKSGHATAKIPVLFMFENITNHQLTEMFQSGGADYITKPFNQIELHSRLQTHIMNAKQYKKLEFLATYDSMTRCFNRRMFFQEGGKLLEYSNEHRLSLSVVVFAISSLPSINEEYGHFMGDKVLQIFSDAAQKILPKYAILGRLGGKEFTAIILGNPREHDTEIIERIVNAAESTPIHEETPIKVEYHVGRKLNSEDSIDSILLRVSSKIRECYITRSSRDY